MRSHHIAVKSAKFEEMKAFYSDVLGFPLVGRFPGRDVIFFDIGGTTIELIGGRRARQSSQLSAWSTLPLRWMTSTPPMRASRHRASNSISNPGP